MAVEFERLPTTYAPTAYKLTFTPNVHENNFSGEAFITILVKEPTQQFILNGDKLEIVSASCNNENAKEISCNEKLELITISFDSLLKEGEVCLFLVFKGKLEENMRGFYRSSYKTETGTEKTILSTQFEPTWARKAFPCFDEPSIKATFTIYLIVLDHLTALSNMPVVSKTPVDTPHGLPIPTKYRKYVKIEYEETPRMSTYLMAIVIGHFDYISAIDNNGVELRVYTPPNKTNLGDHALRMAKSALPYYCEVFGNAFPLPKLDLVAIPDFGAGAMENWGLITYRETALLIDKDQSSLSSKRNVALTVSHELAHMWFGNLVTMEWWTHLWLNEGFATWVEYLAVDHCFPEYDIWTVFLTREFFDAMDLDQLKTSHPIEVVVNSPNEVEEIFDAVSYQKGASLIRMLSEYLGFETFCKGLQCYINKHKYGNAVTEDLWSALERASGKPVEQIMSTWTKQTGFPVLTVRSGGHTPEGYSITIEQTRFLADGSADVDNADWYVPITICEATDSNKVLLKTVVPIRSVSKDQPYALNIPVPDKTNPPAIRLNPGAVSFYRVQYDNCLLPSILDALGQNKLDAKDRLALLSDHFALARAGRISMTTALNLAFTFTNEMEYTIWCELKTQLENIRSMLQESSYPSYDDVLFPPKTPAEEALDACIVCLAEPVFNVLGWAAKDGENHNNSLLRPLILSCLCKIGHPKVLTEARKMFALHYSAVSDDSISGDQKASLLIPADLRIAVFSTIMHHGDETDYQKLLVLYEKATMNDERVRLLHCIGLSCSTEVVKQVVQLTFTTAIRKQDRLRPLMALSTYPAGRRAVWAEVKKRIDSLSNDLGGNALMGYVVKTCCEGFYTENHCKEIKSFFDEHPVACARAIQQALESLAVNCQILERDGNLISEYLQQFAQQINC